MLQIHNLVKRYGKQNAVNGISLSVPEGSFVGVIGRSGAGKSTLLRMINRLEDPTSGSIEMDLVSVSDLTGAPAAQGLYRQRIGAAGLRGQAHHRCG